MSTGKVTQAVDEITAKTPGALIVAFKQNGGNADAVNISTLLPEHYITKQMFLDNTPDIIAPIALDVIPAGTAIPFFIDASLYDNFGQYTDIITKTKAGNNYIRWSDMQVTEVFSGADFTGWDVYLHTDDNIISNADIYIVLKP